MARWCSSLASASRTTASTSSPWLTTPRSADRCGRRGTTGRRAATISRTLWAVSPDGTSVYVTGFSNGGPRRRGSRDFVTLAYRTSTGALRWAHRYNGPGDWNDNAKAITVSADASRLFVTGYRTGHHARDM